ncbi:hypothetical protein F5884DRAFT_457794 [Xylogone sp. PMI_703]|nr:hypothetical protein F5884DRAFT_457794 [Xylogone sp. PMI_703]
MAVDTEERKPTPGLLPAIWGPEEAVKLEPKKLGHTNSFAVTPYYYPGSESQQTIASQVPEASNPVSSHVTVSNDVTIDLRTEWIGTSPFFTDQNIELQINGDLDKLISYREAIVHDIAASPYDPIFYLELSRCDCKLGFTDIGVASAHKALLLIEAGLGIDTENPLPDTWRKSVIKCMKFRLCGSSSTIINDELQYLHLDTYLQLLRGFLGCAAYWDGLLLVKKALKLFPKHGELLEIQQILSESFKDKHNDLVQMGVAEDIVALTRTGKIFQKPYPWIDQELYFRTPQLLKKINKGLRSSSCEVKPAVFTQQNDGTGTNDEDATDAENINTRPLGLFASRDIKEGEIILEDSTLIGISDVPSSALKHCDACHASLIIPFIHPSKIVQPTCCKDVAFCSQSCHDTAMKRYHRMLCGKDWDWLYSAPGRPRSRDSKGPDDKWRPVMFLRTMAIVLNDMRSKPRKNGETVHPLQHELLARMAANYPSPDKIVPEVDHDWQYFENVVAPTKILISLGVNVFTNTELTPEVIQTIYWRLENNANMSTVSLPIRRDRNNQLSVVKQGDKNQTELFKMTAVSLNPNYLFFNHSCQPNVSWLGAPPDPFVNIEWLKGSSGSVIRPGSSTVLCVAARDIKKGEELKISYIGDPTGERDEHGREGRKYWLKKWFENGCGCTLCEKERQEEDGFDIEERD